MFGTRRAIGIGTGWLGVIPLLAVVSTLAAFGPSACLGGLAIATLASFVVFLPLTALAITGGRGLPADAEPPALTARSESVLVALWSLAVLLVAALS